MTESFDLVSYLIAVCPALGILAWVVIHFKAEIKVKDERIIELTQELIDISRDQIKINTEMKAFLELYKKER